MDVSRRLPDAGCVTTRSSSFVDYFCPRLVLLHILSGLNRVILMRHDLVRHVARIYSKPATASSTAHTLFVDANPWTITNMKRRPRFASGNSFRAPNPPIFTLQRNHRSSHQIARAPISAAVTCQTRSTQRQPRATSRVSMTDFPQGPLGQSQVMHAACTVGQLPTFPTPDLQLLYVGRLPSADDGCVTDPAVLETL